MAGDVDADLLRAFVQGDRDAFEALYRRFHREVHAWILRIVRDPSAADDAVVDAFWRAYRSRARFDATRSFGAWMRRIATNASLDQLRTMARRPAQYDGEEIRAPALPDHDVRKTIARAMRSLPPRLRLVAVLALVEEQPLADIADALNVPLGTVKSRLFRATRRLRVELIRLGIQS
jgi:RNA polymerase sigma-70 factor (ECF subfamily)